jgi:hypothetical protein
MVLGGHVASAANVRGQRLIAERCQTRFGEPLSKAKRRAEPSNRGSGVGVSQDWKYRLHRCSSCGLTVCWLTTQLRTLVPQWARGAETELYRGACRLRSRRLFASREPDSDGEGLSQ